MRSALARHKGKILYLVVGGWNTVFGYGAFVLLYHYFSDRIHESIILTISYILGITNAFIGYKVFVFKTKGNVWREYFRFYVVYGGAFMVNLILLPFFMSVLMMNAYAAQAVITFVTIVGSYVLHKRYTFRYERKSYFDV